MAGLASKISSPGLCGAREIARERLASISTVKISPSVSNRIEISIDSGEQSTRVIRTTVSEDYGKTRTLSSK